MEVWTGSAGSHSDNDSNCPDDDCTGHITDWSSQGVDVLCHSDTTNVEGCNREDTQNNEEQQSAIGSDLGEVSFRSFEEGHSSVVEDAGLNTEITWNESDDWQQDDFDGQTEHSFIANDLEWLEVVFRKKLLLEDEQETVCEQGKNNQQVTNNLQTLKLMAILLHWLHH